MKTAASTEISLSVLTIFTAHNYFDFIGSARQILRVSDWFILALGGLVTYRLALMFSSEAGPGRIFRKLRNAAPPKSATREGLSCLHCESVWWAAPVTVFLWWQGLVSAWHTWLWWLAMSGVAIVLHHAFTVKFNK